MPCTVSPVTGSPTWFPHDTADRKPRRSWLLLGSRMQVDGMMAVPTVTLPHPQCSKAGFVCIEEASTFFEPLHWERIWLVLQPRGPWCHSERVPATGASRCVECVQGRSVPAGTPATSLLVLLAFACYIDRRGRGRRILASYRFPLSHEATVLRI